MPNRSEYQPLSQGVDDEETDVGEGLPSPVTTPRGLRRLNKPGHIDLSKLDTAFKRQANARKCSNMLFAHIPMQMDGKHSTESETQEEGRGQLSEGDLEECI